MPSEKLQEYSPSDRMYFEEWLTRCQNAGMSIRASLRRSAACCIRLFWPSDMRTSLVRLIMANLVMVVGWSEYFPWAVPGLYAQGKSYTEPFSY
jgi:hypothetical protein